MSEAKVLQPNNITEASSTTNGEVQTGMLISVTSNANKINIIPIVANVDFLTLPKWINCTIILALK